MKATQTLIEDHEVIDRALGLLLRVADAVDAGDRCDVEVVSRLMEFFQTFVDAYHHAQEEQYFFPALEGHGFPRNREPVEAMLKEHARCRVLFQQLSAQVPDPTGSGRIGPGFSSSVRKFSELLKSHMFKENNLFYQYADEVLNPDEKDQLLRDFARTRHKTLEPGGRAGHIEAIQELEHLLV